VPQVKLFPLSKWTNFRVTVIISPLELAGRQRERRNKSKDGDITKLSLEEQALGQIGLEQAAYILT
jgi:hypothetical protein